MIKWIALITMVIDHLGIILQDSISIDTYTVMRVIGRLSFPLFTYMILQGSKLTSNINKYFFRVFSIAIMSEIIRGFLGNMPTDSLNVMFSLSFYILMYKFFLSADSEYSTPIKYVVAGGLLVLSRLTDYGIPGIILFLLLDYIDCYFNEKQLGSVAALAFFSALSVISGSFVIQFASVISGFLMFRPKLDKRVFSPMIESRLFYLVYPVHFFVLYIISMMIR